MRPKFASLLDTLEDLTTVYAGLGPAAGAPIEIKAEAQDDRLQLLQALEAQGAPEAVVSDAESVSLDVPGRRRKTALPTPQPSSKFAGGNLKNTMVTLSEPCIFRKPSLSMATCPRQVLQKYSLSQCLFSACI